MSLFSFRSKKILPAEVAPIAPPPDFVSILIRRRAVFPAFQVLSGQSQALARQLDVTLMQSGFKLSPKLLIHISSCDCSSASNAAHAILTAVKELVGDHVKHNPYFPRFPRDVPDTTDFWVECLLRYYLNDEVIYGQHLHTFEEMVQEQLKFSFKSDVRLKVIDLGGPLEIELRQLFSGLASATVPLNVEDRQLLATLFEGGYATDVPVRIRENKAILNTLRMRKDQPIDVDTVVDVLRVACAWSDGDVTLATNTKFKPFPRRIRRRLVEAIDQLIARDARKIDDASNYKEPFKRLAEKLHPREYSQCSHAAAFFDFTGGKVPVETFNHRAHTAIIAGRKTSDFRPAIDVLSERPGLLLKHVDLIIRSGNRSSIEELLRTFGTRIAKISGRNLLNLEQHLINRTVPHESRIFLNRLGTGHAIANALEELSPELITPIRTMIREELKRRIPERDLLVVDWPSLAGIAIPISEKNKSDGFMVLPRGSSFPVARDNGSSLRFFIYWKQREFRTDYDLSCACYDAGFNLVTQVSWTNLRDGYERDPVIVHSGDFTDATNGATEFIDVDLNRLDSRITYILPTINFYTGETFGTAEEAFFGFMDRPARDRGLPFDARTVVTKFALKGNGRVCVPMVFVRDTHHGVSGKWLDIYAQGLAWANSVENHKFTIIGLAKAMLEKSFTPLAELVELHQQRAITTLSAADPLPDAPVTYIGLRRPEGLHRDSTLITLESFRSLIPA